MIKINPEKCVWLFGALLVATMTPSLPSLQIKPVYEDCMFTMPMATHQPFTIDSATLSEGLSAVCYGLDELRSTESELQLTDQAT